MSCFFLGSVFGCVRHCALVPSHCLLCNYHFRLLIQPCTQILVLSEDDDTYHYVDASCDAPTAPAKPKSNKKPEKMLIVGWRRDFRDMLMLMNDLMMEGSEIHVLASKPIEERDEDLEDTGVDFSLLTNVELVHHCSVVAH